MSDQVPVGQVPRDEAFWRTYRAVQVEEDEAQRRLKQRGCEHKQVLTGRGREFVCNHCGADRDEVLAQWRRRGATVVENEDGITITIGRIGA